MTASHDESPPADSVLLAAVRRGDNQAYGLLYSRHLGPARALARQLCSSSADADDAVGEAFAKVLQAIRRGSGPTEAFRAYLLQAVRHHIYDRARHDRRLSPTEDLEVHTAPTEFEDRAQLDLERSMAARAFGRLPERWQAVLWHTAVEGQRPTEVAEILGISPTNVTSLAHRAREALRQAYLDCHLAEHPDSPCSSYVRKLGAHARDGLRPRARGKLEEHLATCPDCRDLLDEVSDVSSAMRVVVGPFVLGIAVDRYLQGRAAEAADLEATSVTTAPDAGHSPGPVDRSGAGRAVQAGTGAAALVAVVATLLFVHPPDEARSAPPAAAVPDRPGYRPAQDDPAARNRLTATSARAPRPVARTAPADGRPRTPRSAATPGQAPTPRPAGEVDGRAPDRADDVGTARPQDPPDAQSPADPTEPPVAAPARAVDLTIGAPTERYAETTVPLMVRNRTHSDASPRLAVTLPERTHVVSVSGGACRTSGGGDRVTLECGALADGAQHDVALVIGADDNGDGTFSDQEGDLGVEARIGQTSRTASRFVRVVCE